MVISFIILTASIALHETVHWLQFQDNNVIKPINIVYFHPDTCGVYGAACLNYTVKEGLSENDIATFRQELPINETEAYIIQSLFIFLMAWFAGNRMRRRFI